jgi:hypothetical protein
MGSDGRAALRAIKAGLTGGNAELLELLELLRQRVATLLEMSAPDGRGDHPLRGLYLTQEQAVELARSPTSVGGERCLPQFGPGLTRFAARCGLDSTDVAVLVAALAPDVDSRFEKLYGFVHDDMTRRTASIGLLATLGYLDATAPSDRARFSPTGPLVSRCLVEVGSDGAFLGRTVRVADHVVEVLLGSESIEPVLRPLIVDPVPVDGDLPEPIEEALRRSRLVHVIEGIGGAGVHLAHRAVSATRQAIIVDSTLAADSDLADTVSAIVRHQSMTDTTVIVRSADDLHARAPAEMRRLADSPGRLVMVGGRAWDPAWAVTTPVSLNIAEPSHAALSTIWSRAMTGVAVVDGVVEAVSASFRLTPEQIVRAARAARLAAGNVALGFADVAAAARAQSASGLDRLARRLEPSSSWDDLILPDEVMTLLRELSLRVRWREQVMQQWELGRGWRGRGIAALFAGPSGTGKTTAAEVIANELGYDIHVVDLSSVVDKYIGETEKKLEVIFTEAERTNTVLLFDEADAIFGKRSEVKDARDRYANIEVSYLLQRIERFSGLAILTTNLGANLDEAFTRRLDVVVDFPRPDVEAREAIWRHEFRPAVPTEGIDFEFCAAAFDLTGGNIRNIVITSAYLAAEAQRPVRMAEVVAAVQREYRKMGRLCLPGEFGRFAGLLR